jgi:hypothetical protein
MEEERRAGGAKELLRGLESSFLLELGITSSCRNFHPQIIGLLNRLGRKRAIALVVVGIKGPAVLTSREPSDYLWRQPDFSLFGPGAGKNT